MEMDRLSLSVKILAKAKPQQQQKQKQFYRLLPISFWLNRQRLCFASTFDEKVKLCLR